MIANDIFRLTLSEAARRYKRSAIFRHPLFGVAELHDPVEPAHPFIMQAPLPEIEAQWRFRRDAEPDYIKLLVGRAARERSLAKLEEEYSLPPAERFKRAESTIKLDRYDVQDPSTWDTGYFCLIEIPAEFSGLSIPVTWCGNRSEALTKPEIRPWFFDARAKVLHGEEAVNLARQECSKTGRERV